VFDYADRAALMADGWDFLGATASGAVRDTEFGAAGVGFGASGMAIPSLAGDLWEGMNNTKNSIFRDLPEDWSRAEMTFSFAPTANVEHAGLVIYDHDDDYVELTRAFNSWAGGHGVVMIDERNGVASEQPRVATTATELVLRLDRDAAGVITGSVSTDAGQSWQSAGSVDRDFEAPRLGVIVAGSTATAPPATISRVTVTGGAP